MPQHGNRMPELDGWRGISIALVLAAHLLPLGPKSWALNGTAAAMGMSLFFILSGFLITGFLLGDPKPGVADFLVRRLARIVPLAWLGMALALWFGGAEIGAYAPHFLFYANLPPFPLIGVTAHFWSLCVEMHFYLGIAVLYAIAGRRGLMLLPVLCLGFTAMRVSYGEELSIQTQFRIDEILAGAVLALANAGKFGAWPNRALNAANQPLLILLLAIASHPDSGFMNYLRPYLAALLVGATIAHGNTRLGAALRLRALRYVAEVSFALYVIHPLLAHTWLGAGEGWEKYVKRPLLFAVLFGLAHVSTFYYERHWMRWGRLLSARLSPQGSAGAPGAVHPERLR